jgi:alcohol dehydrogenase
MDYVFKDLCFTVPTKVCFGSNTISLIGEQAATFGKNPLVITDRILHKTVIFEEVIAALRQSGMNANVFDKVVPNPHEKDVYDGAEFYRATHSDMLIAMGGGSVIDSAKAIGVLVTNPGRISDLISADGVKRPIPPLIAIPTTAGSGSEVSADSLISQEGTHIKLVLSSPYLCPLVAILDPKLTVTLPLGQTVFTAFDALSHAIEAYTAKGANVVSDAIACQAISLISNNFLRVFNDGKDLEARGGMLLGSCMAGMAFTNAGEGLTPLNVGLGSVHAMGQVLAAFYDLPHGATMAAFLPYVMEYNLDHAVEKYANVARLLGCDVSGLSSKEAAMKGIKWIKEMERSVNLPSLGSLGVRVDSFEQCAILCEEYKLNSINPRYIDRSAYKRLYEEAYNRS